MSSSSAAGCKPSGGLSKSLYRPASDHNQLLTGSDVATFGLFMDVDVDQELLVKGRQKMLLFWMASILFV
jgi:hypothetical protein